MKKRVYITTLIIAIICSFISGITTHYFIPTTNRTANDSVILLPEHPFYLLEDVNDSILYLTLKHYEFPEPAIIVAQAKLESGNYNSRLCLNNNNLFGLYNSTKGNYFKFDSWIGCVFAYRDYILTKRKKNEDYYQFLKRINYAEDPNYIKKLKKTEKIIRDKYEKF
jgi:hypothetical protein